MPSKHIKVGDIVMAADGKEVGIVKQLGDTCFRIAAKRHRDFWLANDAIEGRDAGIAVLFFESGRLSDAAVDLQSHIGQHSHPKQPGSSSVSLLKPLLMIAGLGAVALKDPERRKQAIDFAREGVTKVKAKLNKQDSVTPSYNPPPSSGYSATSTFTPPAVTPSPAPTPPPPPMPAPNPMPSPTAEQPLTPVPSSGIREASPREEAIVREVTEAFPAMNLRVAPVKVHKLEGGEVETLRFTLDETASSDVEMDRLERSAESEHALAKELIGELRTQLPPEAYVPRQD